MSGAWRKTLIYLGLVEEPEEHDELPERFDRPSRGMDAPRGGGGREPNDGERKVRALRFPASDDAPGRPGGPPWDRERGRDPDRDRTGTATSTRPPPERDVRVRVLDVHDFEDCEDIGRTYQEGQPVLFDLGGVETGVGRRVLDFVSGVTFALEGSLTRVGPRAFLLVPEGVTLPERERRRLADLGFRTGT